ncbi:hypothetical protein DCW30_22040 [Streptomyces alfalfae]|uniref:DUF8175 domain-containing protein n=2 Tax=Streptomyces alfalfae TaxID=1642299 RepID=A0ABM6H4R1_9ACTN|nr:hypothetical protein A7J05_19285 [Streptomyces alfalfae]AYA21233.1 hypothetical protein D3X13_18690 [Streptomyces fradiae]RXX40109.1 hypothetical protein DCW30_22040 [Streptomyces alfalfae]RZM96643.1 hypothetical protein D4104_14465 [Streptomyces alfalfae]
MVWGAAVAGAAVLALTGYAVLTGDDDDTRNTGGSGKPGTSASEPVKTYAPPDEWTEPGKWASLPRGKRTDDQGNPVGFPHTPQGAVAQMFAAHFTEVNSERSLYEEQVGAYESYMSEADQTPSTRRQVEKDAKKADVSVRRDFGMPTSGDIPAGGYMRSRPIGFKIIQQSKNEVSIYALSRVTSKASETAKEKGSYTRIVTAARWENGDWKLSGEAISQALEAEEGNEGPEIAAPGDAKFEEAGWTAIREAS